MFAEGTVKEKRKETTKGKERKLIRVIQVQVCVASSIA